MIPAASNYQYSMQMSEVGYHITAVVSVLTLCHIF